MIYKAKHTIRLNGHSQNMSDIVNTKNLMMKRMNVIDYA